MNHRPIGVFDSGVGGISVLRQLQRLMPEENYLYFGDSANAPYGNRTTQQVQELTLQAADMLFRRGVKALVVACNTATAAAIGLVREKYPDKIVVGIEPALKVAADHFPAGRVGIMATQITLREQKLQQLQKRLPGLQVEKIWIPGLVELVEDGKADTPEAEALIRPALEPYAGKLDALVLGCTHYPFVKKTIAKVLGEETLLLDGGEGTAKRTKHCLEQAGLLHSGPGSVQMENSLQDPQVLKTAMALLQGE